MIDKYKYDNMCGICYSQLDSTTKVLNCNHKFHNKCIQKWFDTCCKESCPYCRT